MENGVREHASGRAATIRPVYGAGANLIDVGSLVRGAPPISMKGTLVSRTVSGAVFGISFGHQSLQPPLWAQPFCVSLIVRIRPCTGWDWIVAFHRKLLG